MKTKFFTLAFAALLFSILSNAAIRRVGYNGIARTGVDYADIPPLQGVPAPVSIYERSLLMRTSTTAQMAFTPFNRGKIRYKNGEISIVTV